MAPQVLEVVLLPAPPLCLQRSRVRSFCGGGQKKNPARVRVPEWRRGGDSAAYGFLAAGFLAAGAGLAFDTGLAVGLEGFAGAGFFAGAGLAEPGFALGLAAGDLAGEAAFLVDMDGSDGGSLGAEFSHYSASGPGSEAGANNRRAPRPVKD